MGVLRCVLLFLLVHHQDYAAGDGTRAVNYSENGSANLAARDPAKQKSKFPLRKCCPPGKVYHQFNNGAHETGEKCQDHRNADQDSSILIEVTQQLFFGKSDNDSMHYEASDFEITSGFPENCEKMMLLEPDTMPTDRFYPLANGDLAVPHRFWIFPPESHCMEDFFADHDYNKVKRVAIICLEKARSFPSEAIDSNNRLQLSFLDHLNSVSGLESLSGRPVIHKCCDINEVYWVLNHTCIPKQGYATQYFDDLLSNGDDLFLQTGQIKNCLPNQQLQAEVFEWTTEYKLQIQLTTEHEEWCPHRFSNDEYCVDDFVISLSDELPETITLATLCPSKVKPVLSSSVFDQCFNEQVISVPPSSDIHPEQPASSEKDVEQAASSDTNAEQAINSRFPKCCPRGFVVEDGVCHQLYELQDQVPKLESALLNSVKEFSIGAYNKTLGLSYQDHFKCSYSQSRPLNKSWLGDFPQWTLRFRTSGLNETSFHLSYYQENYWDYDSKIPHYCIDLKITPKLHKVNYEPHVFFCHLPSSVSDHYPALLYISSIGFLLTFVMYFLTPAEGVSEDVAPADDAEAKSGPKPCHCQNMLANPIASRNFLCHISSLCLAFVCLAVTQQELVEPGQPECVAIGYITYTATIASFSWFTVYCFHFFCMFRLSVLTKSNVIFLPYSLFGWGIPLIALAMAVTAQFHKNVNLPRSINPNMGLFRCWFGNETSVLVFFYVPICFLLSLSSIFFTSLLSLDPKLRRCKRDTKINPRMRFKPPQETRQDAKKVDSIYLATGVAWIFEIAAWIPLYFTNVPNDRWVTLNYLFEAGNVLNASRGVLVFVLFVLFQRDVRGHMFLRLMNIFGSLGIVLQRQSERSTTDSTRRIFTTQTSTDSISANSSKRSLTGSEQPDTSPNVRGSSCDLDEVTEL